MIGLVCWRYVRALDYYIWSRSKIQHRKLDHLQIVSISMLCVTAVWSCVEQPEHGRRTPLESKHDITCFKSTISPLSNTSSCRQNIVNNAISHRLAQLRDILHRALHRLGLGLARSEISMDKLEETQHCLHPDR
jgi:hypothetical protein